MKIPVLDLTPQYQNIKEQIQSAIARVLESGQFIMGPDVKLFEQEGGAEERRVFWIEFRLILSKWK